jgi:hypothetical protein
LASTALRQLSPRRLLNPNFFPPIRLNSISDSSPMRQRSGSVKRKPDDSISYARAVAGTQSHAVPVMPPEKN